MREVAKEQLNDGSGYEGHGECYCRNDSWQDKSVKVWFCASKKHHRCNFPREATTEEKLDDAHVNQEKALDRVPYSIIKCSPRKLGL